MDLKLCCAIAHLYILKEKTKTEKNKKESQIKRKATQGCQGF
jgi:hypothetical protein